MESSIAIPMLCLASSYIDLLLLRSELTYTQVTVFPVVSVFAGVMYGPETLPRHKRRPLLSALRSSADSSLRQMLSKPLRYALLMWFCSVVGDHTKIAPVPTEAFLQATAFAGTINEVLAFSRSKGHGGFGLSPTEIAAVFGLRSLAIAFISPSLYSKLAPRIGPERVAKICSLGQPIYYAGYFTLARMVRHSLGHQQILAGIAGVSLLVPLYTPTGMAIGQMIANRAPEKIYLSRANTAAELAANAGHGVSESAPRGFRLMDADSARQASSWAVNSVLSLWHTMSSKAMRAGCFR